MGVQNMLDRMKYWFFNNSVYVESIDIDISLFSADKKLRVTASKKGFMSFNKSDERFIDSDFQSRWEYSRNLEKTHANEMSKIALRELKRVKKQRWFEGTTIMFPAKLLVGAEWCLDLTTRRLSYKEWKEKQ